MKKILITGSKGFIGKNLIQYLSKKYPNYGILEFDINNSDKELEDLCLEADYIFHLAAIQRPIDLQEFDNNKLLTKNIITCLANNNHFVPIMFSSSIQVELNNPYAECKKVEEKLLTDFSEKHKSRVLICRFPNLFGTMSKPNYTSVVSTFCYNTIHGFPFTINNPGSIVQFAFVEDVLKNVCETFFDTDNQNTILEFHNTYSVSIGELAYYMGKLQHNEDASFIRNDDFYQKLRVVFNWFKNN